MDRYIQYSFSFQVSKVDQKVVFVVVVVVFKVKNPSVISFIPQVSLPMFVTM